MDIAAFILGIVGTTGWALCALHEAMAFVPVTCSILAIVFGIMHRRKNRNTSAKTSLATAGMVLGIIVLAIVPLVVFFLLYSVSPDRSDYGAEGPAIIITQTPVPPPAGPPAAPE